MKAIWAIHKKTHPYSYRDFVKQIFSNICERCAMRRPYRMPLSGSGSIVPTTSAFYGSVLCGKTDTLPTRSPQGDFFIQVLLIKHPSLSETHKGLVQCLMQELLWHLNLHMTGLGSYYVCSVLQKQYLVMCLKGSNSLGPNIS